MIDDERAIVTCLWRNEPGTSQRLFRETSEIDFEDDRLRKFYRLLKDTFTETGHLLGGDINDRMSRYDIDLAFVMETTSPDWNICAYDLDRYIQRIHEASLRRRFKSLAYDMSIQAIDPANTLPEVREKAVATLDSLLEIVKPPDVKKLSEITPAFIAEIEAGEPEGAAHTGYVDIDRLLGYLRAGSFCLIGARPGIGKSTFALNIARNNLANGLPVMAISAEMSGIELLRGFYASHLQVDNRFGQHDDEFERIRGDILKLKDLPLYIYDSPSDVDSIRSVAGEYVKHHGVRLIIVDYLQILVPTGKTDDKEAQVSDISRNLKRLARTLNVPLICLAQVNRLPLHRSVKTPELGDLKGSGALEADADVVLLLHSGIDDPEVYKETSGKGADKVLVATVCKNRFGPCGATYLRYEKHLSRIDNGTLAEKEDDQ